MKTYFACMPCFLNQALRACRFMDLDDQKTRRVINAVAELIPQIPMESPPPETGREVYRIIREISGNADPYQQVKAENTANALALYPVMKQMVAAADNPLAAAVRIAAGRGRAPALARSPGSGPTWSGRCEHIGRQAHGPDAALPADPASLVPGGPGAV
ncbi:MAG: ARMT1-like domain-containing protein, partial [Desulfosalsimonas sp.]